jgi:PAS domain S-box-containing protein
VPVKKISDLEERLFEKSAEAHFILEKGMVVKSNRHARRIFHKKEEGWVGFDPFDAERGLFTFLPDEESLLRSKLEKARKTGKVIKMKVLSKRDDGIEFHSEIKVAQIKGDYEDLQIQDISERMYFDHAIRESEERFRKLSQFAMEGIAIIKDGVVKDANDQFALMFGHEKVPVNTKILDYIDDRDWQRLVARRNWGMHCELRGITKQGKPIYLEATRSESGKEGEQLLMVYDITDRKRIEFDLLQTKERFRMLVESSPIGLFLVVDGRVKYTNTGGLDILNERVEDSVYDELFTSFFKNKEKDIICDDLDKVREGERPPYREVMISLSDGSEKEVGVRMSLSFHDRQPAIQVTVNDLSTRIQLMREQMRSTLAEESNEMLKEEIKKHKQTQAKLREAEELNRIIIESSIDMIVAFDMKGNLLQYNHAFAVEFGIDPSLQEQLNFNQIIAKKSDSRDVWDGVKNRNYYSGEVEGKRLSGDTFSMFISVATMRDEEGKVLGAMGVGRDITDLKIAEEELKESEERYRDILDNASDIIFVVDAHGAFTYANPSFFKKLGHTESTIASITLHDVLEQAPKTKKSWIKKLDGKQGEAVFVGANKQRITVIGGSTAQYDSNGTAVGMRGLYLDITEMRQHESKAKISEDKLNSIFKTTNNLLMFTVNKENVVTYHNNNFQRLALDFMEDPREIKNAFMDKLTPLVSEKRYVKKLKDRFSRAFMGEANDFEIPLKNKYEEEKWNQVFLNPVESDGEITEVSCISYDITDRKEADKNIRSALKEKEILLQEVHHRVKNNLQVISSLLNLQRSFVSDPNLVQVLDESQARIATMSYIHESLYRNTDFSSISFSEYLKRLTTNLVNTYSTQGCEVLFDTRLDEVFLTLDQAIPCGLIVNELVSNVLKYAFVGRKKGTLYLRVQKLNNRVEIEVSDNGVGLPDDFETKKNDSLGIYLVHALIEQLSADLKIESTKDGREGSLFLLSFES